jgi:hypothetical protein
MPLDAWPQMPGKRRGLRTAHLLSSTPVARQADNLGIPSAKKLCETTSPHREKGAFHRDAMLSDPAGAVPAEIGGKHGRVARRNNVRRLPNSNRWG